MVPRCRGLQNIRRRQHYIRVDIIAITLLALPAYYAERVYATVGRPSVRPSVCPSTGPQQQTRCCRFAAVGPAGRRYRLIAAAAACGGGNHPRMRAVTRCQRTWKLTRFCDIRPPSTPPPEKKSLSRISVPVTVLTITPNLYPYP